MGARVRCSLIVLAAATAWLRSHSARAEDFGEVGVGAQMMVVAADSGAQTGFGATIRTRFLWILGFELSADHVADSQAVYAPAIYRTALIIHAIRTRAFDFYLSPGLAGDRFGDAFNPVGDSTWYRLGGGMELRLPNRVAFGIELHWTLPDEAVTTRYVEDHQQQLLASYLASSGTRIPANPTPAQINALASHVSTSDLLALLPLDRFEVSVGVRYYF